MKTRNIIVLSQIEDTVTLYVNQFKYGYRKLFYFLPDQDRCCIELDQPEITITDLVPGQYYFYCQDDNGKETGDIKIDISYETKSERYHNIVLHAGQHNPVYTDIVDKLQTDDPVLELYHLYQTSKNDKEPYEALLQVFTNDYNARPEMLNLFVSPLFTLDKNTRTISSYDDSLYTYLPYRYNSDKQEWSLLSDHIKRDVSFYQIDEKPSQLYRISVLSEGKFVRRFYVYQPSASYIERILEDRIQINKNIKEYTAKLIEDPATEIDEKYKTAAAILYFDPVKPILCRPEIEIEDDRSFTATIPDYHLIELSEEKIFLAALETEELYGNDPCPHKMEITAPVMTIKRQDFLVNADTEYVFYFIDAYGTRLSQVSLVSFDPGYPVEEYSKTYRKIQLDRYSRKLYAVFQEYDPEEWEAVSLLLNRYFLNNTETMSFFDYLLTQVMYLDNRQYNIPFIVQLILLCDLQFFMDIDQDFIKYQVYGQAYKTHVLPRSDTPYLIRAMRFNNGHITYDYYKSGNSGTEIHTDKDDMLAIQCIDPDTWKMSSIAFYNNKYTGAPYFYFPKLEVTVDAKLS